MAALIQRQIFADFFGLAQLGRGEIPDIEATKDRLFIIERRSDPRRPDHFYKDYLNHRLVGVGNVDQLPSRALSWLATRYVERSAGGIKIKSDRFSEWHELLPYISPLAVLSAFLAGEDNRLDQRIDPRAEIYSQIGDTALIGPENSSLDNMVEREGLCEPHMHLNGSTELDVLWPSACRDPDAYYRLFQDAFSNRSNGRAVRELYYQIEPGLVPITVYRRLRAARRVRKIVAARIAYGWGSQRALRRSAALDRAALVDAMSTERRDNHKTYPYFLRSADSPATLIYGPGTFSPLVDEAAFMFASIRFLEVHPDDPIVGLGFYFNLLVQRQLIAIAVQQVEQSGFDQFQKMTLVGVRELEEQRQYVSRFKQINIKPPHAVLTHIEGRFAPKATASGTRDVLERITKGYLDFRGCDHMHDIPRRQMVLPACLRLGECTNVKCHFRSNRNTRLVLTAHFIKKPRSINTDVSVGIRDYNLRNSLNRQARALVKLFKSNKIAKTLIVAVDAAANELHASPEPFASTFRIARRAGIPRATFHAGEDFRHLISGIRAVAEAIEFAGLKYGDRVGHATALGIDPALWIERAPERVLMPLHDRLDDAVFAHEVLASMRGFDGDVMALASLIAIDSERLYGAPQAPSLLYEAWKLRKLDYLIVKKIEATLKNVSWPTDAKRASDLAKRSAYHTLDPILCAEYRYTADILATTPTLAYKLFLLRHSMPLASQSINVEMESNFINSNSLSEIQNNIIGRINKLGISIEVLMTSNLRISYYDRLSEHHLFRWLGISDKTLTNRPTVIIGSDDPGIFATNLKNEYSAVFAAMQDHFGLSSIDTMAHLAQLVDAAHIKRFRP